MTIGGTNTWGGVQYLSPHIDPVENFNPYYVGGTKINTPRAVLDQNTYYSQHNSTNHAFTARITPIENLSINSTFSYSLYQLHTYRYYPGTLPKKTANEGGEAYRREFHKTNLSSETTVNYKIEKKRHHGDVMAGFSTYYSKSNDFSLSGSGYMDDEVMWNNMNAVLDKNTYSAGTSYSATSKMSAFARINYNYDERYYLTFTGRADGASNFAASGKWAFFPSGAFRWNISNEHFMKNVSWVGNLALRLSAGISGNDAISAYRSLAALSTSTSGYIFNGTQPVATYTSRLAAPDLTWEKTASYNAAVDAEFFRGRLNLTVEGYYANTTDLLLTMQVPTHTGFSSRYGNIGNTTNKGFEITIDTKNIARGKFGWKEALIPPEQVAFLRTELAAADGPCVPIVHQQLDAEDETCIRNAAKVRRILEASGKVRLVIQGHLHEGSFREVNGIGYFTGAASVLGSQGMSNAFALVEIYPSGAARIRSFNPEKETGTSWVPGAWKGAVWENLYDLDGKPHSGRAE